MVSELREVYPQIRRIHYRTDYPDADAYTMQFLLDGYEDSICPDGVAAAGKAAYVERNQAMIRASDFCVFYYNNEYLPASRKESKKAITTNSFSCPLIASSFSCTIFSDIVCFLLSECCVVTSFYQSLQTMSLFFAI